MSEARTSASEASTSDKAGSLKDLSVEELLKRVIDDGKKMFQMLRRRTEAAHWHKLKSSAPGSIPAMDVGSEFDRRTAYLDLLNRNHSFTEYLAVATAGEVAGPAHRIAKVIRLGMEHMKGASLEDMTLFIALDLCEGMIHHADGRNALMVHQLNAFLERDFRNFFGEGEIPNNFFIQHEDSEEQIRQIAQVKMSMSAKLYGDEWAEEIKANPDLPESERIDLPAMQKMMCMGFIEELLKVDLPDPAERMREELPSLVPMKVEDLFPSKKEADQELQSLADEVVAGAEVLKEVIEKTASRKLTQEEKNTVSAVADRLSSPSNVMRRPGERKEDLSQETTAEILNNIKRFVRTDFGGQEAHTFIMAELAKAGLPSTQGIADFVIHKMRSVASGIQKRISPRIEELRVRHVYPGTPGSPVKTKPKPEDLSMNGGVK